MQHEGVGTLSMVLDWLRYHEVRAIAAALGLGRRATENQKGAWVAAIAAAWLDPVQADALLERLTPAAAWALWRLVEAGALPRELFLATYGALRLPGDTPARANATDLPWRQPQTVSEELFYSGLLLPAGDQPILVTPTFRLPTALGQLLAAPLCRRLGVVSAPYLPVAALPAQPLPLLHDLAQWLIYLHQQRDLVLLHARWLPPRHLAAFQARLVQPGPRPAPSHKQARGLALLSFLAAAAELTDQTQVTAAGWQWLAADPAQQLRTLWTAWLTAAPALRTAYVQPASGLPAPWPALLLAYLDEPFTPAQVTNRLLGQAPAWHGYFVAHLPTLSAIDGASAEVLAQLLSDFGAIAPATARDEHSGLLLPDGSLAAGPLFHATGEGGLDPDEPSPAHQMVYQLTALGRWLLDHPKAPSPQRRWQRRRALSAQLTVDAERFTLTLALDASPLAQAQLAPFALLEANGDAAAGVVGDKGHRYLFTAASVGQAAAAHHGLPTLLAACATLGLTFTPDHLARLQAWHAAGQRLQLLLLPVVRTADAELMAQLYQNRALQTGLGELLNPTVAVWQGAAPAWAALLSQQGFYPDSSALDLADNTAAPEAPLPTDSILWLAARTYQLLGQFLPLPVPLSAAALRPLAARLSPLQQAALQAHLAQLEARLRQLFDHLPFMPPPEPSNPAQWRPLLAAASAAKQTLRMIYYSAGRNLPTQRLIDPYWIEEQHGVPYLRAYCHSAGTVLTFRLDRIQALEEVQG